MNEKLQFIKMQMKSRGLRSLKKLLIKSTSCANVVYDCFYQILSGHTDYHWLPQLLCG